MQWLAFTMRWPPSNFDKFLMLIVGCAADRKSINGQCWYAESYFLSFNISIYRIVRFFLRIELNQIECKLNDSRILLGLIDFLVQYSGFASICLSVHRCIGIPNWISTRNMCHTHIAQTWCANVVHHWIWTIRKNWHRRGGLDGEAMVWHRMGTEIHFSLQNDRF